MEMISTHISYEEATHSEKALLAGINNTPNLYELANMRVVALAVFEPIRTHYGKPIRINSFYRSFDLNNLLKGASNSQHIKGEAIDFSTGDAEQNFRIYEWAKHNLKFDQLIAEHVNEKGDACAWVHVSFKIGHNRNVCLLKKANLRGYLTDK